MNEVGTAADAALPEWNVDGSDLEDDSDVSLSESDGSEGEVPALPGHLKEDAPPGGVGKGQISAWKSKSSHMTSADAKEGPYARGWKPVIDGRVQVATEAAASKARNAAMLAGSTVNSQKHDSTHMPSGTVAGIAKSEIKKGGNESDSDMRRVPDMSAKGVATVPPLERQVHSSGVRPRKRGGGSADKEHKRLKRLLRNRVSAQQARERKKAYLSELEVRSKELTQRNEELEERVSTLQRENYMLRQIVKNTTAKKPGGGGAGMET